MRCPRWPEWEGFEMQIQCRIVRQLGAQNPRPAFSCKTDDPISQRRSSYSEIISFLFFPPYPAFWSERIPFIKECEATKKKKRPDQDHHKVEFKKKKERSKLNFKNQASCSYKKGTWRPLVAANIYLKYWEPNKARLEFVYRYMHLFCSCWCCC